MASQRSSKSPVGAVVASQQHIRTASELSMTSETAQQRKHEDNLMAQLYSQTEGKDLPLRTMYILNCASRGQHPLPPNAKGLESVPEFTSILQTEMSQLPLQRTSLPYVFVRKFVKETFCQEELGRVNFSQALTALDYLKDIELRRQKMVQDMWQRVDIETWESIEEKVSRDEAIIKLFNILNRKEKYLGELYAWLYVHLRQWILVHEIKNQPFDKHNCMAMLNTLWPPIPSSVPDGISKEIVQSQRKDFFKTINSIPGRGMADIDRLIMEQAKEGEPNGWPCTAHMMNKYMQKADEVIDLAERIQTRADLDIHAPPRTPLPDPLPSPSVEQDPPRKGRKQVDSGVSFGSAMTKRPSTSGSDSTTNSFYKQQLSSFEFSEPKTPTRVRINRVLHRLSRKKTTGDLSSQDKPEKPENEKSRTLRKMRSLGAIAHEFKYRNMSGATLTDSRNTSVSEPFNAEEMKRKRMAYEESNTIGQAI
ncbi:hypothetical protein SLS57_007657 [Botryosphaeria dothidea]